MLSFLLSAFAALVALFLIFARVCDWLSTREEERASREACISHQKRIIAAYEAAHEARMRRRPKFPE